MYNNGPLFVVLGVHMSISKEERLYIAKDSMNVFRVFPYGIGGIIAGHLSVKDIIEVLRSSITTHNLFKPNLISQKAKTCVVQGDLQTLKLIAKAKPEALFQKGRIIDPRGRIFYDVSAYQMIHFLCDVDMKNHITPLIPEKLQKERQLQIEELGHGGADLIKLSRDPRVIICDGFGGLTQIQQRFNLINGAQQELSFPLLENVDGLIYYQDEHNEIHFFYVNRNTQTLVELEQHIKSKEDLNAWIALKASFENMELNSARRSSDEEHQLINTIFNRLLTRQGIQYQHNKVRYRDSRTSFNLINAYRKCIRLYAEAEQSQQSANAHSYWRMGVGLAQGEEIWLMQRICEENRRFHPLPAHFDGFERRVVFVNLGFSREELALSDGNIVAGWGSAFALYKGRLFFARCAPGDGWIGAPTAAMDLVAINRLVEDAKALINDSVPKHQNQLKENISPH